MADLQEAVRTARQVQNLGAEQRFRASAASRNENARLRHAHGTGVHDDLERLQARADRLLSLNPQLADAVGGGPVAEAPAADRQRALEKIIDASSELQSVTFLPRGTRAARPVARISASVHGRDVPIGTGFLVSPSLLMTNSHVLPLVSVARKALVEFRVELDIDNRPQLPVQFRLDPSRFFFTDADLDVTVVCVGRDAAGSPGESFGWLRLSAEQESVVTGEELNIIGHPRGRLKEIAIRNNKLVAILPQFLQYTTDTETGNSGSPVFNSQWDVVGLHHASVAKRDAEGRRLRKDGKVWQEGDGEDAIWWIANEGVRISAILERLSGQEMAPEQAAMRAELQGASGASRPTAPVLPDGARGLLPSPPAADLVTPSGRSGIERADGFEGVEEPDLAPAFGALDALASTLRDLDAALARARREIAGIQRVPEARSPE